jgi:S-ribosylhomocysteine lyase LuxS involved in autoinducer biosynthesis
MAEAHHIEHSVVALVRRDKDTVHMTIGTMGTMTCAYITTRAGIEALRDACEAALRASAGEVGK